MGFRPIVRSVHLETWATTRSRGIWSKRMIICWYIDKWRIHETRTMESSTKTNFRPNQPEELMAMLWVHKSETPVSIRTTLRRATMGFRTASNSKCTWAWVTLDRPMAIREQTWAATIESIQSTNLICKQLPLSMAACKETTIRRSHKRLEINNKWSTSPIIESLSSLICPKLAWVSKKGCKICRTRKVDRLAFQESKFRLSMHTILAPRWDRKILRLLGMLTVDSIRRMSAPLEVLRLTVVTSKEVAYSNKTLFTTRGAVETPKAKECSSTITSVYLPTQLVQTYSNTHPLINKIYIRETKLKSWWQDLVSKTRTAPMTASSGALLWAPIKFRKLTSSQDSQACQFNRCKITTQLTRFIKDNQLSLAVVSKHKIKLIPSWRTAFRQLWEHHPL